MSANRKNGYQEPLLLSNPKTLELYKKTTRRHWTKEEAQKMLVELGTHTKTGRLRKRFR